MKETIFQSGGNFVVGPAPASAQVSIGTTATLIFGADVTKRGRTISNQSGVTVFVGPSGVTTGTGFAVPTGSGYDASNLDGPLYGIVATGSATIGTLQY
jgi:hypothetical protein